MADIICIRLSFENKKRDSLKINVTNAIVNNFNQRIIIVNQKLILILRAFEDFFLNLIRLNYKYYNIMLFLLVIIR